MLHVTPFPHFHQVKNPSTPLRLLFIPADNIIINPDPRFPAHFASLLPTRLTIPRSPRESLSISETPCLYRQTDAFQVEHGGTAVAAQQIPLFLANRAAIFPLVRLRRRFRAQNRGSTTLRGRLPRGNLPLVGRIGGIRGVRGIRGGIRRIRRRIRRRIGGKIRIRETPAVVRFIVRIRIEFFTTLRRIRRRFRRIRFEFHDLRPFPTPRFRRDSRGFRRDSRGFRRRFCGRFSRAGRNRGDLLVGEVDKRLVALERAENPAKHDFLAGRRHQREVLGNQNVETGVRGRARGDGGKSGLRAASASRFSPVPRWIRLEFEDSTGRIRWNRTESSRSAISLDDSKPNGSFDGGFRKVGLFELVIIRYEFR